MRSTIVLAAMFLFVFSGCVSSSRYEACLAGNEELNKTVEGLGEDIKVLESEKLTLMSENSKLKAEVETLNEEAERLSQQNAELGTRVEASRLELIKEAGDLSAKIRALDGELLMKDSLLADMKAELDRTRENKERLEMEAQQAVSEMKGTYEALVSELHGEIEEGRIAITSLKDKLSLSMVEKVLFDSGSATVKPEGNSVLDRVAGILKNVKDKQIRVEGHTDNVPIGPRLAERFPTNWELSSQRATNVVRYLQEKGGIDTSFLSTAAYAEYSPVAPNDTEEGRAKNRRIEIVLIPLDTDVNSPGEAGQEPQ